MGPLAGVTVAVTPKGVPGSQTVTTASDGSYALPVPVGPGVIALSGLPPACRTPAVVNYSVAANDTSVVNIPLSC